MLALRKAYAGQRNITVPDGFRLYCCLISYYNAILRLHGTIQHRGAYDVADHRKCTWQTPHPDLENNTNVFGYVTRRRSKQWLMYDK